MGASYQVTENVTASLAWMHGFRNSIQGPILQIPGSSVRLDAQVDTLWAGVNVKFGGHKRKGGGGSTTSGSGSADIPPPATWGGADVPATPDAGWPEIPMPMPPLGPAGDASAAPNADDAATSGADAGACRNCGEHLPLRRPRRRMRMRVTLRDSDEHVMMWSWPATWPIHSVPPARRSASCI